MAIAIAGALIIVAAIVGLRVMGGGWPMSPYPPRRFVTSGIYALVAHPLYLGSILVAFGLSIAATSPAGLWIVTPVLTAARNHGRRARKKNENRAVRSHLLPSAEGRRVSLNARRE